MVLNDLERVRTMLLELESTTRRMAYVYDNRYARAHLKEINLQAQLSLIQLDYAELAHEGLS